MDDRNVMKMEKKREIYKTIPLNEVKKMLGFIGKGYRTVAKWCKINCVIIFGEGQQKRILESDWIRVQVEALKKAARYSEPILKKKLTEKGLLSPQKKRCAKYQPKTEIAKNFLKGEE